MVAVDLWVSDWYVTLKLISPTKEGSGLKLPFPCYVFRADCYNSNNSFIPLSTCGLSAGERNKYYAGLVGSAIVSSIVRAIAFSCLTVNAARVLHNKMFKSIVRAPIRFFDVNPTGKIIVIFVKHA